MPKLNQGLSNALKKLSSQDKDKIILRLARGNKDIHDMLSFELLPDVTLDTIEEQTKELISELLFTFSGRNFAKALGRAILKAEKEVARIKKITKSTQLEIDLLRFILNLLFTNYGAQFDNPYKGFSNKTGRLTLKLYKTITKNLHPDSWMDYKEEMDNWLNILHERATKAKITHSLPTSLEIE